VALEDFSKHKIKELEDFFTYYNKREGKEFKSLGTLSAKDTWKMIREQYTHHEA
jgi:inorganic pyrophosphatase